MTHFALHCTDEQNTIQVTMKFISVHFAADLLQADSSGVSIFLSVSVPRFSGGYAQSHISLRPF